MRLHFLPSLLHSESTVVQILEGLKGEGNQLIAKTRIESLAKQFLLVSIIGDVTRSVTRETVKLPTIGTDI